MAMSPARMLLYFFGILLVVMSIGIFFFQTGLDEWVPVSLLVAGILLIIGLAVMGFADNAPSERVGGHSRGHHDDDDGGDVTVVNK